MRPNLPKIVWRKVVTTYMKTLLNAMSLHTEHYECDKITKDSIEDQYGLSIVMLECHYANKPICQLNASFNSSIVMLS